VVHLHQQDAVDARIPSVADNILGIEDRRFDRLGAKSIRQRILTEVVGLHTHVSVDIVHCFSPARKVVCRLPTCRLPA
jgi:hypothetical protein